MARRPPRHVEELLKRSGDVLIAYGPSRLSSEVVADLIKVVSALASDAERLAGRVHRSGPAAGEFMELALSRWTNEINAGPGWSGAKSLFLLRRLPMELLAMLVMGADASDRQLTGCIVGTERLVVATLKGRATEPERVDVIEGTAVYRFGDEELLDFMRRVVATSHLWLMQCTARIVGKGCDVIVDRGGVPAAVETEGLRRALDVYDKRSRHIDDIGIAGTQVWRDAKESTTTTISWWGPRAPADLYYGELRSDEVAQAERRARARQIDVEGLNDPSANRAAIDVTYIALPFKRERFDLAPLGEVTTALNAKDADWYEPDLLSVLALLHALDRVKDEVFDFQVEHSGYLRTDREGLFDLLNGNSSRFADLVAAVLPEAEIAPRKLMTRLLRAQGSVYPTVDGPLVSPSANGELLVDLVTASRRVIWLLTLTSSGGGSRAVARGGHFEALVRSEIQRLGYGPRDNALAEIVGRQLKRNGEFITDIDGIVDLGDGTVLFVSAKSYPYTAEYASGRYAAVSAITSKVLKDIKTWEQRLHKLLAAPTGPTQNFQLPARNYVGLVVTPFSPFLPSPECDTEAVPGLRRTGSLKELTEWLSLRTD